MSNHDSSRRRAVAGFGAGFLLAGAALTAPGAAFAQEPTLERRLARLCDDLEQRRQDLHISGLSLAVVKDDRVILARGFGLRDREKDLPADEHTLYAIGSTTKAFTAMLCAMLASEGKLALSDPPRKHLPWFKFKDPAADAGASLNDLLRHRTGLTRNDVAWVGSEATREDLLRSVAETETHAPFFVAGKGQNGRDQGAWQYNNNMYLCAGECAAAVAGIPFDELIARRIFEPLGMKRSVTTSAAALADPRLSQRYDWKAKTKSFDAVDWMAVDSMAPAGSICSTVLDMAQWLRFLLRRGEWDGKRLVGEAEFAELWRDDDDFLPNYGLGWFLHPGDDELRGDPPTRMADDNQGWRDGDGRRHLVVEHGGNVAGYAAEVGLLPALDLGVVLLTNTSATQLQGGILPMVWDAIAGPWKERKPVVEGPALAAEATASWLGAWKDPTLPFAPWVLSRTDERLTLILPPTAGQSFLTAYTLLWPGEDGRFHLREEPESYVTFARDEKGGVTSLTLVQGYVERRRVPVIMTTTAREPDCTLDELVERRADAAGFDAATGWSTLRLTGTLRFVHAGVKGRYEMTARGTDALRVEIDSGRFGRSTLVVSGGRGALLAKYGGQPDLPPEAIATVLFANPRLESGDWRDHAEDVQLDRMTFASAIGFPLGAACYAVSVKPWGADPFTLYVAADDARLVAIEGATAFAGAGLSVPYAELADVRDVQGFKIPFRRSFYTPDSGRMVLQLERAEVDVELPDDWFEVPAAAAPKSAGS